MEHILQIHNSVFSRSSTDVGFVMEYIIELVFINEFSGNPIFIPPYKKSFENMEKVTKKLDGMEKSGLIEKCISSWSLPLMAIPKRDDNIRIVQNFKKLNELLIMPRYPIPNINSILHNISLAIEKLKAQTKIGICINVVDITCAYNVCPIRYKDRTYTSFIHASQQYQWKTLPQGLSIAPSAFCCIVDNLMSELNTDYCFAFSYLDDFITFQIYEKYEKATSHLLKIMESHGVTLDIKKCLFNVESVKFLGHLIDINGVTPIPAKLQALAEMPLPTNLKTAQGFCGAFAFYTKLAPRIQLILKPISEAIGKGKMFKMNKSLELACQEAKTLASEGFGVSHIKYNECIFVVADTSLTGIGAAIGNCKLISKDGDNVILGNFNIVSYASRALKYTECLLSSRFRELICISFALEAFIDYIPKHEHFYVITDHQSLKDVLHSKISTSSFTRVRKCLAIIYEFPNLEIVFAPGRDEIIQVADGLSRNKQYAMKKGELDISEQDTQINTCTNVQCNNIHKKPLREQVNKLDLSDIMFAQKHDDVCSDIYKKCIDAPSSVVLHQRKEYKIKKGILYRVNSKLIDELYIPEALIYSILSWIHVSSFHSGRERLTYFVNENNIYIPQKSKNITKIINECLFCQWISPLKKQKIQSFLRPAITPLTVFAADLCDFSKFDKSRIKYVLVIVDKFSLYADCVPLESKKAVEVCQALALLIHKYSIYSLSITTDCGREFDNLILEQYLNKFGIIHCKISPYNPMSNRTERVNGELKRFLKVLDAKEDNIGFYLQMAVHTYNSMPMKKYDYMSPFQIIFGIKPRLALAFPNFDDNKNTYTESDPYSEITKNNDIQKWVTYQEHCIRSQCHQNAIKYHSIIKPEIEHYDIGDHVLAFSPQAVGGHKSLNVKFTGPYQIISRHLSSYKIRHVLTGVMATRNYRLLRKLNLNENLKNQLDAANIQLVDNNIILPVIDNSSTKVYLE